MSKRNQCETLGITERVYAMYHMDGMSLKSISEKIKKDGYDVSKASIHRAIKAKDENKKELSILTERTKILIETVKGMNTDEALEEMSHLFHEKILSAIQKMDAIEDCSPGSLLKMYELLNRANSSALKLKMAYEKGFNNGYEEGRKNKEKTINKGLTKEASEIIKKEILGI